MSKTRNRYLVFPLLFFFVVSVLMLFYSGPVYAASTPDDAYIAAQQNILSMMDSKEEAVYGNEWYALDLIRDEQEISPYYLKSVVDTIIEKEGVLHTGRGDYTNYAKTVLALSALGIDATNVAGYNLIQSVSSFPLVQQQGVNGVIYALLALDSRNYEVSPPSNLPITVSRDNYINSILNSQLEDGGWDWADKQADPDMTAMAIQALAPYYDSNENVKTAVDTALDTLSRLQQNDGGFLTEDAAYAESSESTSMVIMALTALGIDPTADSRFIKNGCTAIDNLCEFAVAGGFKHTKDGSYNALATDQGYRALTSYFRLKEGKTSLYDMSDVGEAKTVSSALSEQVQMKTYKDTSEIQDDIDLIENSSYVKDIEGKLVLIFDLQLVLADDSSTVYSNLSETDDDATITATIPEEQLEDLGETVFVVGVHDGQLIKIEPDSLDRSTGRVTFKASQFSTYAIASGTKKAPDSSDDSESIQPETKPVPDPSNTDSGTIPSGTDVKTGDEANISLWIMLLIGSLIVITTGTFVFTRSRKKGE